MNILLITSDQQHWNTLGTINNRIKTPNLDRLADQGTHFTRAYCSNPVCSPSRSSIITGLYPAWHHCWTIGVKLPEDVPTLGDVLRPNGYRSILIGKAHFQPTASQPDCPSLESMPNQRDLDFWRNFYGPFYGFDHVELTRNHADEYLVGAHYALWMEQKGLKNWREYFQSWPPDHNEPHRKWSWNLPEEYHYSAWTAERTIAHLEEQVKRKESFFLWSSFHDPHPPYLVPEPWASMYRPEDMQPGRINPGELDRMPIHYHKTQETAPDFSMYQETPYENHGFHSQLVDEDTLRRNMAVYYGMVSFMDRQIGRILDAVDRLGLTQDTLVLFTTDHGHYLGQHGLTAKGAFHYEDLLRIPMLARLPGRIPSGRVCSAMQSQVDFAPTFLTAAGVPVPGIMQGVNQWNVWQGGKEEARDHIIVENRHQPKAVHLRTYVNQRYKITVYRTADYGELFDLENDPCEQINRWDDPEYATVKSNLLLKFVQAEIQREPTRMPRIAGA